MTALYILAMLPLVALVILFILDEPSDSLAYIAVGMLFLGVVGAFIWGARGLLNAIY